MTEIRLRLLHAGVTEIGGDREFALVCAVCASIARMTNAMLSQSQFSKMRSCIAVLILSSLLLTAGLSSGGEFSQTIQQVKTAVVGIGTLQRTRNPPINFIGSGFVVADGFHVITNAHVIPSLIDPEKKESLIILHGPSREPQVREAQVVDLDRNHDIALLKIAGAPLPTIKLGDSDRIQEGQTVAFTGYPIGMVLGLHPVTHRGMVSAITPIVIPALTSRQLDPKTVRRLRSGPFQVFQLDATAYPGNSGSPLYDIETGTVYGVINMVFVKSTKENVLSQPSGITYAIPSNYIRDLLKSNRVSN